MTIRTVTSHVLNLHGAARAGDTVLFKLVSSIKGVYTATEHVPEDTQTVIIDGSGNISVVLYCPAVYHCVVAGVMQFRFTLPDDPTTPTTLEALHATSGDLLDTATNDLQTLLDSAALRGNNLSDLTNAATARTNLGVSNSADLTTEQATRAAADTTLATNLATEATTRGTADTTLQSNITAEATARTNAGSAEATTRGNADTAISATVSAHTGNTSNPHSATAAQVGAYTTAQTDTLLAAKAANNATLLATATGQMVNITAAPYGAVADGATDASAAFSAALTALATTGGVIWCPAGTYRINSQLLLPNDAAATPHQKPIRITGPGGHFSGQGSAPSGGAILDLRYTGGGTNQPKIETLGLGVLEIDHVTLTDFGTSSNPFIHTTNTDLLIHECGFIGNIAKATTTCDQDAIVLGGITTDLNGTAGAAFQGYSTVIENNYFNHIRRGVYLRTYTNGISICKNKWWAQCGSNIGASAAAVEMDPLAGEFCTGNVIFGNLIEMNGYVHGMKCQTAVNNVFLANNFFDAVPALCAGYIRFESTANYNLVIAGYSPDTDMTISDANGGNTLISGHAGSGANIQSKFSQGATFGGPTVVTDTFAVTHTGTGGFAIQPAGVTSDNAELFIMRRSLAESSNPGSNIVDIQQNGNIIVGGTLAGNMLFQDAAGTALLAFTSNGKIWTASGGGGNMEQNSGTGGSYFTHKNYGVKFQDHNAGPLRLTIGAGQDGMTFGAAGDTNLKRTAADTLQTNDKFIADLGLVGQGGTTAQRPATPVLYQEYIDATLGKKIWCSNATGPVWKDAMGNIV